MDEIVKVNRAGFSWLLAVFGRVVGIGGTI